MKSSVVLFLTLNFIVSTRIDFDFYHKTEDITSELSTMTCWPNVKFKQTKLAEVIKTLAESDIILYDDVRYYDIGIDDNTKRDNVFILAGEHARELISPELLLNFIKFLCGSVKGHDILQKNNFRIIVNLNANGRKLVERGDYCKRTNIRDVDLNRNWDVDFGKETNASWMDQTGPAPFSEIETQFANEAVKTFQAKMFLSVHSGVTGLFMPYAYSSNEPKLNKEKMTQVLSQIKKEFCSNCFMGSVRNLIGYTSSGTCLDYIYDNYKVPYSFAWEIYTNETRNFELEQSKKHLRVSTQSPIAPLNQIQSFISLKSHNHLVSQDKFSQEQKDQCLNLFNPLLKEDYDFILSNWTNALVKLIEFINLN